MNLDVNPADYANKLDYWEDLAMELAMRADEDGVIVTIARQSMPPLAMRNHIAVTEAWEKR